MPTSSTVFPATLPLSLWASTTLALFSFSNTPNIQENVGHLGREERKLTLNFLALGPMHMLLPLPETLISFLTFTCTFIWLNLTLPMHDAAFSERLSMTFQTRLGFPPSPLPLSLHISPQHPTLPLS